MKILHTSDWHLGQKFMGKSREEEHRAFFAWLYETIVNEKIDLLIVSGDIFDTGNPPHYALELYYNLLQQFITLKNLYVIIIAGNHDSVSMLKAPKQLLEKMNIFVITSGDTNENELIPIYIQNQLKAIVCAVPFLRDSIVRTAMSGQTLSQKEDSLNYGIKKHYKDLYKEAKKFSSQKDIPLIATGHLTTVGGRSSQSERDIYIGGTIDIGGDFLGNYFDYVALGHLHINQKVGVNHVRYSGSPIPLSFSESKQIKKVNIVDCIDSSIKIKELEIPLTRKLLVIKGDLESILQKLETIEEKSSWIEVHLDDKNPILSNQTIREYADKNGLTILAIKIDRTQKKLESQDLNVISLDQLTPNDVFTRRLSLEKIEDKEFQNELNLNFKKVLEEVSLV